jgi:hypothetical protein
VASHSFGNVVFVKCGLYDPAAGKRSSRHVGSRVPLQVPFHNAGATNLPLALANLALELMGHLWPTHTNDYSGSCTIAQARIPWAR